MAVLPDEFDLVPLTFGELVFAANRGSRVRYIRYKKFGWPLIDAVEYPDTLADGTVFLSHCDGDWMEAHHDATDIMWHENPSEIYEGIYRVDGAIYSLEAEQEKEKYAADTGK